MKAVILEINDGFVAALSKDGCITKVKNKNYMIGQVIDMKKNNLIKFNKLGMWASTAAAFVLVCGVGAWSYLSPYTYVSLDVNPSIEYSVNRFDRVLSVKAVNDDGEEILKEINLDDLTNKTISEALKLTVDEISKEGYFGGDLVGGIIITTSAKDTDKAEELAQELQEVVEEEVKENGDEVVVEAISVAKERVEQAKELGVTPGKLNLVEKLQASAIDPSSINLEEWLGKPVKEIMKATKDNKKAAKAEDKKNGIDDEDEVDETATSTATQAVTETALTKEQQVEIEKIAEKLEKEKVKAEVEAVKEAAKEAANEAKEAAKEAANEAKEAAKEAANEAKEAAKKAANDAKDAENAAKEANKVDKKTETNDDLDEEVSEKVNNGKSEDKGNGTNKK